MKFGPSSARPFARFGVLVLVATALTSTPHAADFRPDPASPLATDGKRIYAIAIDRQSLLVSDVERPSWNRLRVIGPGKLQGLAYGNGRLFFADASDASIQSVSTSGEGKPEVLYRGAPLVHPTELAYSGRGLLVIADPGARALFRLPIASGPSKPSVVELSGSTPISDNTLITGLDDGEVLIADRESGLLAQLSDLETSSAKYRAMQSRPSSASSLPVPWNQQPERPETLRRRGYPGITSPRAMDAYAGILYVLNGPANDLFLCAFHDARAIRAPKREFSVTRIVATQDWLFGIDRASGRLIRSPRLVPSELTLLPGAQYQSLLPVLEYLKRHKLLATRAVEVSGTIEQTLARERMAWPARGTVAEPYDRRKNVASFCLLNPNMCKDGLPVEQPPGSTILLAELYAERYTSATRVTLDGSATLGEVVDRLIESEEFHQRRSEEFLRQMNGVKADDPRVLRAQREGVFRISQEQVRYVIPIEVTELRPGSEFNDLVGSVYSTIRIAPLQRVASSKAGIVSGVDHPDDANCTDARAAMKELLTAINFAAAVSTRTVFVGVAEDRFDAAHRDFKAPADPAVSVLYAVNHGPDLTPAPPPADGAVPPGVEPMTYRAYRDEDHGTAIASIIAGRTRAYQEGAGLSDALIAMLVDTGDLTALGTDIERVLDNSTMSVINMSLTSKQTEALKLRMVMEASQTTALYVVAAPNLNGQVTLCTGNDVWYPACHGAILDNVLVVGGTTLKGDAIYVDSPIGKDVHLFAPAADYFAAGLENAYVKVQGTSFATALVSAAAAVLSAMDDAITPAQIKQRLMTTATVMNFPNRLPWARRLDVKRAVSHLKQAVIVDTLQQEQLATVVNKRAVLNFRTVAGNQALSVPVGSLRRLTRIAGAQPRFDLAYVVPAQEQGRADVLMLQTVKPVGALNVCYLPLNAAGLVNGVQTCVDLAETSDYVAAIR